MDSGYSAYDSHDGGSAYAFIETQPQVRRAQQTLQPQQPPDKPEMQTQPQQPQQPQQPHQQQLVSNAGGYNGAMSSAQADEERQAMFFRMQENLQMQQDTQRSWTDRCWQKRRDVLKLVIMALVILLALSAHSVVVFYIKMYVEESSLSPWREFFCRSAYPVGVLLILWAIKGSQSRASA